MELSNCNIDLLKHATMNHEHRFMSPSGADPEGR